MHTVYIGLGSNLVEPERQLKKAVEALTLIEQTLLVQVSSLYASKPMGPQDQPDYMNAVAKVETKLSPIELLDNLQQIELTAGRVRKEERWGARVLDLDILLIDNLVIDTPRLTVPHYGMKVREFVIYPLAEISPNLTLPDGTLVTELKADLPENDLVIIGQLH
ncbi:2-amino-4-hydroxy-6-hydroxymethyldihydropteridine diphosphokinase [Thalassotalea aquiviva]|uniref:2-amino-4-hydroxy-6- hydroxymethyldihydropteridine diphosphokinase n=1 Tax=Thalassotalea aquiviva TaxID=3242415 RepID=UPI00352A4B12